MSNTEKQSPNTTKSTNTMMGSAPSRCERHDFTAANTEEWNKHCEEFGHTDTGVVLCTKCGTEIGFDKIPYQNQGPKGKDIQLRCEKCIQENDDLNRQILQASKEQKEQQALDNNMPKQEEQQQQNTGGSAAGGKPLGSPSQ